MQIYSDKLFRNPLEIFSAFDNESFILAFNKLEELKNNYYLVGYIRYEAKDIFLGRKIKSKFPLLYFEAYKDFEKYLPKKNSKKVFLFPRPKISFDEYKKGFEEIKSEISNGNSYEVNYTFDFEIETKHSSEETYNYFLNFQKTPFNAFIKNSYEEILSFSPELFFRKTGNKIFTKPMKGTIERGKTSKEDLKNIEFLKNDIKNRAENIMIVDLLRNDLGKISQTGSVKVPKLFDIETHKTLHQMTSEIEATLKNNTTLYDIFNAIFPCGSITGAPKISTMNIIDRVETGKRNIYCGAIGIIHKDFCEFSVPIRILQRQNNETRYTYRAGGAIVWDSEVDNEWKEAILKTSFLSQNSKNWQLIETIRVENLKPLLWKAHLERLQKSAYDLNFVFNKDILNTKFNKDGMYRILLSKKGNFEIQFIPIKEILINKIRISNIIVNSTDTFLQHKTTYRPYYEEAFAKIKAGEIYDEIFFNEKGELTEGSRSNLVLEINGELYTPPCSCGLLAGTFRGNLLKKNKIKEKILYKTDLDNADKIYCINSVRGMRPVKLWF